ncbi:hydrogenase maturation nickel metallochaperone HypA [bacterium]|nr:hydrogenase maturation nickel metallochaperone HypA [bacterium]
MHEISLIQSLLTIIDDHAREHGFKKVNQVSLSCGRLSTVEPLALDFAFKILTETGICAGAELKLDILPLKIHCFSCDREFESKNGDPTTCPNCNQDQVTVTGGWDELQLIEMDVD